MIKRLLAVMGMTGILVVSGLINLAKAEEKGLVASYQFKEGKGERLEDSSGNGYDGIIHGASWVETRYGNALKFDGVDDYVTLGRKFLSLPQGDFSLSAWVIPEKEKGHILSKGYWGHWEGAYSLRFIGETKFLASIRSSEARKYLHCATKGKAVSGMLCHVVTVFDRNAKKMCIYLNGVKEGEVVLPSDFVPDSSRSHDKDFLIGALAKGDENIVHFGGSILNVKIYNKVLSAEEIKKEYQTRTPIQAKLQNWWELPGKAEKDLYLLGFWLLGGPQRPPKLDDDLYLNACLKYKLGNAVVNQKVPRMTIGFLKKNNLGYVTREVPASVEEYKRICEMERTLGKGKVWLSIHDELMPRSVAGKEGDFSSKKEAYEWCKRKIMIEDKRELWFPFTKENKIDMKEGPFTTLLGGQEWLAHYLFEWGLPCVMQEWGGTMGNNQILSCFTRGAARQYNGYWGTDNAGWFLWPRYSIADNIYHGNTRYNEKLNWIGGRHHSFLLRMWLHSYFSGANIILREGSAHVDFIELEDGTLMLSPAGWYAKRFADFTLRDFPERGKPYAPVGLLLEKYHGFRASGESHNSTVFFGKVPNQPSDQSILNFFEAAFPYKPNPNARIWSDSDEYYRLANAGAIDPRRDNLWRALEPTRWGESFDVYLENASLDVLKKSKAIFLLGGIKVNKELLNKLKEYTRTGGIVLVNTEQIEEEDNAWLGVKIGKDTASDTSSRYKDKKIQEPSYTYRLIKPTSAKVLAVSSKGDPLVTENTFGKGKVILTTFPWYQDRHGKRFLNTAVRAIDDIMKSVSVVNVDGPLIDYLINRTERGLIITLINNGDKYWKGELIVNKPPFSAPVFEMWNNEQRVNVKIKEGKIIIPAYAPKYGVSIYTIGHFRGQNVALGKPVTTFPPYRTPAHRPWPGGPHTVTDGKVNYATGAGCSAGKWLQVDMEEVIPIHKVNLVFQRSGDRYSQYKVIVSEDGQEWKEVIDQTKNTTLLDYGHMRGKTFTFDPVKARYVRVVFTGGTRKSISELRVFSY